MNRQKGCDEWCWLFRSLNVLGLMNSTARYATGLPWDVGDSEKSRMKDEATSFLYALNKVYQSDLSTYTGKTSPSSSLLSSGNGLGWKVISFQTSVKRDHLGDKWQTIWLVVCWVLKGISEEVLWNTCLSTPVKLVVQMENSTFCFMADLQATKPQGCQVRNMSWSQAPAGDGKEQLAGKMWKYDFLLSVSLSISLSPYIITYVKWPIPCWRMITIHCAFVLVQKATSPLLPFEDFD